MLGTQEKNLAGSMLLGFMSVWHVARKECQVFVLPPGLEFYRELSSYSKHVKLFSPQTNL